MATGLKMGKKKVDRDKPGKPPTRVEYLQVRMTNQFKDWLERYAASRNLTMADVIVQDLIRGAKAEAFEPPPKR